MSAIGTLPETPSSAPPTHTGSDEPGYKRLTLEQLGKVARLTAEGLPQTVIAEQLGVTQSAISRAIHKLGTDTTELATLHFRSRSYRTARRLTDIVEKGSDDNAIKASKVVLAASGVLKEDSGTTVGVQVVIGMPGQPVGPPLDSTRVVVVSSQADTPVESAG
jgi:predicted transcriptional regulator